MSTTMPSGADSRPYVRPPGPAARPRPPQRAVRRDDAGRPPLSPQQAGAPANPASLARGTWPPPAAHPRRGAWVFAIVLGVLAGVLAAAAGASTAGATMVGLAALVTCRIASRLRRRRDAARDVPAGPAAACPDPIALRQLAAALEERLAAFGHQMSWEAGADQAGSTATGTCRRCGGQVTAGAGTTGAVTVSFPGQVLLVPGRIRAVRWCGGGRAADIRRQIPPDALASPRRATPGGRRVRLVYAAAVGVLAVVFAIALGPGAGLGAGAAGLIVYAAVRFAASPPPTDSRSSAYRPAPREGRK